MKGIVQGYSSNYKRIAVMTDYGYTVFDIEQGQISLGDVITGNLNVHGWTVLTNETKKQKLSVYIEAIQATKEFAESLLCHK